MFLKLFPVPLNLPILRNYCCFLWANWVIARCTNSSGMWGKWSWNTAVKLLMGACSIFAQSLIVVNVFMVSNSLPLTAMKQSSDSGNRTETIAWWKLLSSVYTCFMKAGKYSKLRATVWKWNTLRHSPTMTLFWNFKNIRISLLVLANWFLDNIFLITKKITSPLGTVSPLLCSLA